MNFSVIKAAVAGQWERMQKGPLFRAGVDGDELWAAYLTSFPPGTNPVLKVRTEHDCSCCKQFIRAIGNVVGAGNQSIWDCQAGEYQAVVDALAALVKSKPIVDVFLFDSKIAGTGKNFQELVNGVRTWTHFFVNVDKRFVTHRDEIPTKLGEIRSARDVFLRALNEITDESVEIVLDLIASGSLYRGEEMKKAVKEFKDAKEIWRELTPFERAEFSFHQPLRTRNTVIGTLLVDLSEGVELDKAVRSYEAKVAPVNYKRPTALITQGMIDKAKAKIEELGLTSALERRYATIDDLKISDVLFLARPGGVGGLLDDLTPTAPAKVSDRLEVVPIDRFIGEILPRAESVELLFENRLVGNLVSLIAPVDPTSQRLFKWDNKFSWSYNGDVADSVKERVKRAGGEVNADLCCRLAWYNYDDLDLHLMAPDGHISFRQREVGGGMLDVDMNAGSGKTREAVENIFYRDRRTMTYGQYSLIVNQFCRRETEDIGFEVEIDYLGTISRFVYNKMVAGDVVVAKFRYGPEGLTIIQSLPMAETVRQVWGLGTGQYWPVSAISLSPNYWTDSIGNKHYFFMIPGCKGDGARGFYNEFLAGSLEPHRKVLEVVGSRLRIPPSPNQLSGLGFSSTQRNTLICRVKGSYTRTVTVQF